MPDPATAPTASAAPTNVRRAVLLIVGPPFDSLARRLSRVVNSISLSGPGRELRRFFPRGGLRPHRSAGRVLKKPSGTVDGLRSGAPAVIVKAAMKLALNRRPG